MQEQEEEFSLKQYFIPLTNVKATTFLILIGFLISINSFFNAFLGDDIPQIVENPVITSISNLPSFFSGSTFYSGVGQRLEGVYYKPLLNTYFAIMYGAFQLNAFAFHFFQVIIFIANSCLLFFILKHFLQRKIAFVLSLLFLVHPINNEIIFYISAAQEALFFCFGASALLAAISLRDNKREYFKLLIISFLLLFSLFSKETGVLFLISVFIYIALWNSKNLLRVSPFLGVPFFIYLYLRIQSVGIFVKPLSSPIDVLSFPQRLLNVPLISYFYIEKFFFPVNLSFFHQWAIKEISFTNFFLPLLFDCMFFVILLSGLYILHKKQKKLFKIYLFFLLLFVLGMGMHLQIIPLDVTVAQRWFYFPFFGLLGIIGVMLTFFKIDISRKYCLMVIVFAVVLLSFMTILGSFDWRTEYSLLSHDIKVSKDDYRLESGMANELIKQGKLDEAKIHAQRSVSLYPFWDNYLNLGAVYLHEGDYKKAREQYLIALRYGNSPLIYENLALVGLAYGDKQRNREFIENIALKKFPQDAKLWMCLAIIDYTSGEKAKAKLEIEKAYSFSQKPDITSVYNAITNNRPL